MKKKILKMFNLNEEKPIFKSDNEKFIFDKVVITCGAFSKKLTDNLNEKIPLDTEEVIFILKIVIIF